MYLTVIPSQYERKLDGGLNEMKFSHEDLLEIISHPKISQHKNTTQYFFPLIFNYDDNGKSYSSKTHVQALTAIILDIDDECTIDEFMAKYGQFKYYLYTTYSHQPQQDRFRVIIPIEKPLSIASYDTPFMRYFLKQMFPMNDPHKWFFGGYYLPSCNSMNHYRWFFNPGRTFSFHDYHDEIIKQREKFKKIKFLKDAFQKRIIEKYKDYPDAKKPYIDVSKNDHVLDFLTGRYSVKGGNAILYRCIQLCIWAKDWDTYDKVVAQAKRDGWTDREIQQKMS